MNTPANRASLPAVTAAGIVAIIFSLFGALVSFLGGVGFLLLPQLPQAPQNRVALPPEVRGIMVGMMLFMLALSVFGIFVGIGILRRRNWARITILVWGGIMGFFCLAAVAFSLVLFSSGNGIALPNTSGVDAARAMAFAKIFLIVFYGIPAAVGIWWLVLFTRSNVAMAFTQPAAAAPTMDASGFPQPTIDIAAPQRPTCPLALMVLAVFFIFSSACTLVFLAFPMPYAVPMYVFGHSFSGAAPKVFLALVALVMGGASFAMLKLKPWGLYTLLAVQGFFLVNGIFMVLTPRYVAEMRDAMEKASNQYSTIPGGNPFFSEQYFRSFMGLGLLISLFFVALLVFYRSRFLEQAAAAGPQS
jgi:hypothetical protein